MDTQALASAGMYSSGPKDSAGPKKHAITDVSLLATALLASARAEFKQDREAFQQHLVNLEKLDISVCEADIKNEMDLFLLKEMRIFYEELRHFLKNANILVYDRTEVHKYLQKKADKMSQEEGEGDDWLWVWRPLRTSDASQNFFYCDISSEEGLVRYEKQVFWRQYDRMLPEAILETVKKIVTGFPAGRLFVSDFVKQRKQREQLFAPRPDPFLAVAVPRTSFLIVDFWNEPGFYPTRLEE